MTLTANLRKYFATTYMTVCKCVEPTYIRQHHALIHNRKQSSLTAR